MTASRLLLAYRLATSVLTPLAPRFLADRQRRRKEDPARIGERMGLAGLPRPEGPLVWLHGASVGESVALLPLIEALTMRGLHVLVTTGTVNSARVMAARLPAGAIHQFVPLDVPLYVTRFLDAWTPGLVLFAESELWPNMLTEVARRGLPLGLVNARLSARSARRWAKAPGFIGALLAGTRLCLAQTQADAARFSGFGAGGVMVAGNLKFDVSAPPASSLDVSALAARIGTRPVFLGASTHRDEEGALIEAHRLAARDLPGLLTILVPRQPGRGTVLAAEASRRGFVVAQRSLGEEPGRETELYVADTIGELGLFYRLSDLVFLGKSLVAPGGGQNPIEAAKLGCAILHGPHVGNFKEVYDLLAEAGGARCTPAARALGEMIAELLSDVPNLRRMARAAGVAVERQGGATQRILAALGPWLPAPQAQAGMSQAGMIKAGMSQAAGPRSPR